RLPDAGGVRREDHPGVAIRTEADEHLDVAHRRLPRVAPQDGGPAARHSGRRDLLGAVSAAEARVSEAVRPAVDEAWEQVAKAKVKHTDGTTWLKAGVTCSLWTIATAIATVYRIVVDSSKATLKPLFGALHGILVSDRAKALNFWAMERRQICWAHLLRKFVGFSERAGPAGAIGRELLGYAGIV